MSWVIPFTYVAKLKHAVSWMSSFEIIKIARQRCHCCRQTTLAPPRVATSLQCQPGPVQGPREATPPPKVPLAGNTDQGRHCCRRCQCCLMEKPWSPDWLKRTDGRDGRAGAPLPKVGRITQGHARERNRAPWDRPRSRIPLLCPPVALRFRVYICCSFF